MKNLKYYFQHDYEATSDPKIICMLSDYGATGYGIYWRVVEMLHKSDKHSLPMKEYMYMALAKQMAVEEAKVKEFIKDCISKYELFHESDGTICSDRVLKNIQTMEDKKNLLSSIRKEAGRKGGLESAKVRRSKGVS